MKPKNIALLLVLVVALWAIWAFSNKSANAPSSNPDQAQPASQGSESGDKTVEEVPNALEGELKLSNDKKRGNYMLMLNDSDRVIYLNTSRDFSSLTGKQVQVSIEGSQDDFILKDIVAK